MAAEYWLVFSDGTINWKVRTPEFVRIEKGDSIDLRSFAAEADPHEPREAAETLANRQVINARHVVSVKPTGETHDSARIMELAMIASDIRLK